MAKSLWSGFFITIQQQNVEKVKNPANIFKYFKHWKSDLEAHGGGQFVDFLCEHIGEIHI